MHPDAIIDGLKRELSRLRADEKERRAQIEAEIARVDKLPRPRIAPELSSLTVTDKDRDLLVGLRRELARTGRDDKDHRAEIQAEIQRVEAAVSRTPVADEKPARRAVKRETDA